MNDDRGAQIEALCHEALALPEPERQRFLRARCGSDHQILEAVETLIRRDQLQTAVPAAPLRHYRGVVALAPGTVIGRYRIVRLISEGGFGEVYLAQQSQPVQRSVALKVLKPGMDSREVVRRFEAERQALAMMDHPGIAHVFDSGATDDGRPYFVMEYVPGVPIDTFCDVERIELADRLRLFVDVCRAVHHAHQKGVIHRDLKPSNILVQFVDGRPAANVIDFGIAKAVGGGLSTETIATVQGSFIGTPEYMSPEQAEASGLNVDTRTDVYSLGVMLYQLLIGVLPIDSSSLRGGSMLELPRAIRTMAPARPSARLRALTTRTGRRRAGREPVQVGAGAGAGNAAANVEQIASCRRTTPQGLIRHVRGDLDWITMKALEKERSRRYESANEFAADIERHFRNEPVLAGPPTVTYRVSKFVRRNKAFVTAAAIIGLVLILGIIGTTSQWVRAERQARTAAAINEFMREIIVAPDPVWMLITEPDLTRQSGPNLTVAQALTDVLPLVDDHFAGQPAAEADARFAIGRSFSGLSRFAEAESQLARAMGLYLDLYGENDPRTRECMRTRAFSQMWIGRGEESEELSVRALESCRRNLGESHPETIESKLGLAMYYMDKFDEAHKAEALCREALESLEQGDLAGSWEAVVARAMLAFSLNIESKNDEALSLARGVLADLDDRGVARTGLGNFVQMTLGNIYLYRAASGIPSDVEEAERHYRDAVILSKELAGDRSFLYATSCQVLSHALILKHAWSEAEQFARIAYEVHRGNMGDDHGYTQTSLYRVLVARFAQQPDDADRRRELQRLSRVPAQQYASESLLAANGLADYLAGIGRDGDAILVLEWAEPLVQETIRQGRPEVIWTRELQGMIHAAAGRDDKAVAAFLDALSLRERFLSDEPPRPDVSLAHATCEMNNGEWARAEPLLIAAHDAFLERGSTAAAVDAAGRLVTVYEQMSRPSDAAQWRSRDKPSPSQK